MRTIKFRQQIQDEKALPNLCSKLSHSSLAVLENITLSLISLDSEFSNQAVIMSLKQLHCSNSDLEFCTCFFFADRDVAFHQIWSLQGSSQDYQKSGENMG
ncbi:hypothetical protein K7X08_008073 [Anisodus acutangulus]|uniref:Uncharacterized protein n=1 Tax=Anisodus acutangulus TaxID=402998 RepID=A0A9Q1MPM9_9SOLA|nr:hypothetical protein K7X08_008073 [Anisodus acutangulus]